MKTLKLTLLVLILCLSSGCASMFAQKAAVKFSEYEKAKLEDVQLAIQGTKDMMQTLDFRTGLLVGIFEPYKDEIPQNIIAAIKQSRELVKKYQENGELTDYEYGLALGLQIRLRSQVVHSLVKKYAPSALGLIGKM